MTEPPQPHDPTGIIIAALRAACPSFEPRWAEHIGQWADTPEDRGPYLDVGVFADHLVGLLERGDTTEFETVFAAVERLYDTAGTGPRYLLSVGLLESIQNVASHRDALFAVRFRPWLGPRTTAEWDRVNAFWGTPDAPKAQG